VKSSEKNRQRKRPQLNSHLTEDEKISNLQNIALILGSLMIKIRNLFILLRKVKKKNNSDKIGQKTLN